MNDDLAENREDTEELDDAEKLDDAFREMEMIYRSRCVDVPLSTNVKVVDLDKKPDDEPGDKQ